VRKLVRIFLIFVAMVVAAVVVAFVWPSAPEPVYHGRRLRDWIEDARNSDKFIGPAREAVLAYGTNAIPYYLKLLRTKPNPPIIDKILGLLAQHHLPDFGLTNGDQSIIGLDGLILLGPRANAAVPALVKLFRNHNDETRGMAYISLVYSGVDGARALTNLLADPNPNNRRDVARGMVIYTYPEWPGVAREPPEDIDAATRILIPALISHIADPDQDARVYSIDALGLFAREAEKIVPLMARIAQNTNTDRDTRLAALFTLRKYGTNSASAHDSLLIAFNESDPEIVRSAGWALLEADEAVATAVSARYSKLIQNPGFSEDDRENFVLELGLKGVNARAVVPALLEVIDHDNGKLRQYATWAVEVMDPEAAAGAGLDLMDALAMRRSKGGYKAPIEPIFTSSNRLASIHALGRGGSPVKESVKSLLSALKVGDDEERREAGIALKKIAPEEAAKAGVE